MNDIERFKKLWIYDPDLFPVKIYCSNFSKYKLWIMRCSKEVIKFLFKYIPYDIVLGMWLDKDNIAYINFKSRSKLKKNLSRKLK